MYFCSLAWTVACTPLSFTLLLQKLSFESLHHRIILHILRFLYCLLNKVQTNTPCEIVASYFCFLSSYQPSRQIISPPTRFLANSWLYVFAHAGLSDSLILSPELVPSASFKAEEKCHLLHGSFLHVSSLSITSFFLYSIVPLFLAAFP